MAFGLARKVQLVQRRLLKQQQRERTGRDKTPLMPEKEESEVESARERTGRDKTPLMPEKEESEVESANAPIPNPRET